MNSNITFTEYVNRQLKYIPVDQRKWYIQSNKDYQPVVIIHDITVTNDPVTISQTSMIRGHSQYTIGMSEYINNVFTDGNHQLCGCHHLVSIEGISKRLMFSTGFAKDYETLVKHAMMFASHRECQKCLVVSDGYIVLHDINTLTGQLVPNIKLAEQFNIYRLPTYIAMMYNDDSVEQNHKLIEKYHQWCEL